MTRGTSKKLGDALTDLFGDPDAVNKESGTLAPAAPRREKPEKKRGKENAASAGQAYLPGLSRRGRPRLKNALSASERAKAHRERHVAEGGKRLEILLTAEVISALEGLVDQFQEPRSVLIARLIQREAKRVQRKKGTA